MISFRTTSSFGIKSLTDTRVNPTQAITCGALNYRFGNVKNASDYFQKIEMLLRTARGHAIDALLLPEYAGQEWSWTLADDEPTIFKMLPKETDYYLEQMGALAKQYAITLIPGTIPIINTTTGKFTNRAYVFSPKGDIIGWQDKISLTQSEIADGFYEEGKVLTVFSTEWGNFAILICYDLEFPELALHLMAQNVDYIFAPTYTPSRAGFNRVQISARARAHENQCFVIHATAEGQLGKLDEYAIGKSGIYGPIIEQYAPSGRFETWVDLMCYHTCTTNFLEKLRKHGEVRTYHDQSRLMKRSIDINKVTIISLNK